MNNIGLIIAREYLTRVKKRSFIIMTLLTPLLIGAMFFFIGWSATREADTQTILVIDESEFFVDVFESDNEAIFIFADTNLDDAKTNVQNGDFDGLLYIPSLDINTPEGVTYYAPNNPSISMVRKLAKKIEREIENIKLTKSGIEKEVLDNLKADVSIATINLTEGGGEKETNSFGATGIGWASGFIIYMFIFVYGAMCMRGVVEEKTSRIIEVIIASVKPFQLMLGKVLGIASVGLTQFVLWIILGIGISTAVGTFMGGDAKSMAEVQQQQMEQMDIPVSEEEVAKQEAQNAVFSDITNALSSVNIPLVIVSFLFYFLAGYLLYGALFAAIGSAVDSDADAQQFMFPVTIPLILAMVSLNGVINDPNGSLAFWMSMIPFTSPVIMMMRVPFGVPIWELVLSMVLMIGGFVFTIWVASRIYRIGILMHGTKVNYKVLAKWFMQKN